MHPSRVEREPSFVRMASREYVASRESNAGKFFPSRGTVTGPQHVRARGRAREGKREKKERATLDGIG